MSPNRSDDRAKTISLAHSVVGRYLEATEVYEDDVSGSLSLQSQIPIGGGLVKKAFRSHLQRLG